MAELQTTTPAHWLAVLERSADSKARAHAAAVIGRLLMDQEVQIAALVTDSEEQDRTIGALRAENEALREYQRQVLNAATPKGFAVVHESVLPKPIGPATTAVLNQLRLVKPGGS